MLEVITTCLTLAVRWCRHCWTAHACRHGMVWRHPLSKQIQMVFILYKCKKNCSLSTTYNGDMTQSKTAKIMNGDITLEALRRCQRDTLMKGLSISFAFSYILCVVVCKRWNVSCWCIYSVICAGYSEADLSTYVRYEFPYPTVSIVEEFVYF